MTFRAVLSALGAVALAVAGLTATAGTSPAAAADVTGTQASQVFIGSVAVAQRLDDGARRARYLYVVNVKDVYAGDIDTQRVRVRTASSVEPCSRSPLREHSGDYYFLADPGPGSRGYVVTACNQVGYASQKARATLESTYGQPRDPISSTPSPEPQPVTLQPVDDSGPTSLTRTAAPGAALVIIALLGLVVVRRRNRRRG